MTKVDYSFRSATEADALKVAALVNAAYLTSSVSECCLAR
jgi:hypothetical protein